MFRGCGSTETVGSPKIRLDDVAAEGGREDYRLWSDDWVLLLVNDLEYRK